MTVYTLPNGKTTPRQFEYHQAWLKMKFALAQALKADVNVLGEYFDIHDTGPNDLVGLVPAWVAKRIIKLAKKKAKRK